MKTRADTVNIFRLSGTFECEPLKAAGGMLRTPY